MTLNDSTDDDSFCDYALQPLYVLTKEAAIENATCFRGVWTRWRCLQYDVEWFRRWSMAQTLPHVSDHVWTPCTVSRVWELNRPPMSETQLNTVVCNTKRVPHYFKFIWSQCLHCLHHSKTGDCSCREDKYNRFISLPGGKGILATICGFKQLGYPQCAGDIGETHIPITAPKEYPKDYLNSKGQYYPVLQSVADHNHNLW